MLAASKRSVVVIWNCGTRGAGALGGAAALVCRGCAVAAVGAGREAAAAQPRAVTIEVRAIGTRRAIHIRMARLRRLVARTYPTAEWRVSFGDPERPHDRDRHAARF